MTRDSWLVRGAANLDPGPNGSTGQRHAGRLDGVALDGVALDGVANGIGLVGIVGFGIE